ncbi:MULTISPECIES: peroxiredoxin [unclassified Sphingomonas]|uniref:peroxiredoxin n=1 Tax=unclassified Sphingomonas TaxID=196159 RepID=UPI00226AB567|nr:MULTISPECIES: peroxiredoxin [unclassified Sphingomonas]
MDDGATIPAVRVTMTDGREAALADLARPLVVYFYPKDDTPGCTREAQDFSALADDFAQAGVTVVGISKDPPEKHAKFAAKHALSVTLATDPDGSVCDAFGVWGEKNLYGRVYMGIERATFLFGADGTLMRQWRKVKVPGHAQAVLAAATGG